MRRLLLLTAATTLMACSQPQQPQTTQAAPQTPIVRACNALEPDMSRALAPEEEGVAAAALPPELPGGPITPGIYDLTGGVRVDGAPAWPDARAVSIEVAESADGVTFNWAQASATGEAERWTAQFHQGPPAQLSFTCGRTGEAQIAFTPTAHSLQLRIPDASGVGALRLTFEKRA